MSEAGVMKAWPLERERSNSGEAWAAVMADTCSGEVIEEVTEEEEKSA